MTPITTQDLLTANVHFAMPAPVPVAPSWGGRTSRLESLLVNYFQSRIDRARRQADPRRNIAEECGHPTDFTVRQYQYLYESNGIAARVVEVYPAETWKVTPLVYEDEDSQSATPFEAAWDALGTQLRDGSKLAQEQGSPIWEVLRQADVDSGIGRYGVVLLGLDDGKALSQPAGPRKGQKLLYLRSVPEAFAETVAWDDQASSPRYGRPIEYEITFGDPTESDGTGQGVTTQTVHWTRVVHVCDGGLTYARPRLKQVLPYVLDCWKVLASDAEAFWQQVVAGTIFEVMSEIAADPGVSIDAQGLKDEYEKFINGLQRALVANGFTAKRLTPDMADPTPHFAAQLKAISIAIDCPQRTLEGSELGRLAADQDSRRWDKKVRARRDLYVTPRVIAPFVDRCIFLGVLPEPERYFVSWPDEETQTAQDRAVTSLTLTQALAAYVAGNVEAVMTPLDYLTRIIGWSEEEATAALDNAQGELAALRAEEAAAQQQAQQGAAVGGPSDAGSQAG